MIRPEYSWIEKPDLCISRPGNTTFWNLESGAAKRTTDHRCCVKTLIRTEPLILGCLNYATVEPLKFAVSGA